MTRSSMREASKGTTSPLPHLALALRSSCDMHQRDVMVDYAVVFEQEWSGMELGDFTLYHHLVYDVYI